MPSYRAAAAAVAAEPPAAGAAIATTVEPPASLPSRGDGDGHRDRSEEGRTGIAGDGPPPATRLKGRRRTLAEVPSASSFAFGCGTPPGREVQPPPTGYVKPAAVQGRVRSYAEVKRSEEALLQQAAELSRQVQELQGALAREKQEAADEAPKLVALHEELVELRALTQEQAIEVQTTKRTLNELQGQHAKQSEAHEQALHEVDQLKSEQDLLKEAARSAHRRIAALTETIEQHVGEDADVAAQMEYSILEVEERLQEQQDFAARLEALHAEADEEHRALRLRMQKALQHAERLEICTPARGDTAAQAPSVEEEHVLYYYELTKKAAPLLTPKY
eukprot:SM000275S10313  [mRNA]  locus=s275:62281:66105:+ [translate_table: standard]